MALFKCKMCGGDLEVTADSKIVECEYCGTSQTVPAADNEKKINLFNRANRLRMASEFDKAAGVYESIVAEFPEEPEAYWGLCLCKYGIEYVDDPATAKKIPTCHRTAYESIFEDSNFELALECADTVAIRLYREEAKEIDRLQKAILEIAAKEEPFDIFICYKETAEDGQRTKDSVLAQDMYDVLTAKGYKVFFARITLEDKLGREYEPYIFSALNSARVMLALGTKYEYYNAVWIKNEWSRFLDLMKKDKEKNLIPCYCDIDAYDMPSEFKNLQGQDMSKIGFMQDLVRGIGKIMPPRIEETMPETISATNRISNSFEPLLKRAFIFLEDGDWENSNEYFEKVLDIEPECGEAYLGKLMLEVSVKTKNDLSNLDWIFSDSDNYKKAYRFSDNNLKVFLENSLSSAKYNYAKTKMQECITEADYVAVSELFCALCDYKDSKQLAEYCRNESVEYAYNEACKLLIKANYEKEFKLSYEKFRKLGDYKDSKQKAQECEEKAELSRNALDEYCEKYYELTKEKDKIIKDYERYSKISVADSEYVIIWLSIILFIVAIVFFAFCIKDFKLELLLFGLGTTISAITLIWANKKQEKDREKLKAQIYLAKKKYKELMSIPEFKYTDYIEK